MVCQCYDNVMTMLWQCNANVMTMLWQCNANVMTILWQCYNNVMRMLWHCYDTVMTLLWQCYDNVLTMLWQCYDNVPRTVILFPFTPTVLVMIYWIIHKIYDVPSIMWGKAGKKLQRSWQRRVVFTSCPYLIFATRTPAAVLVQKKLSAWAWFSSKTLPQAKRHRPSLLFTAKIYFSARIKTMLESSNIFLPCTTMFKAWTSSRLVGVEMQGSLFFVIKI